MKEENTIQHIAFIMDGNRRWAKQQGLSSKHGHTKGIEKIREVVSWLREEQIPYASFYFFSLDNLNREKQEKQHLYREMTRWIEKHFEELEKNNIQLLFSGEDHPEIPPDLLKMKRAIQNKPLLEKPDLTIQACFMYSGRTEIVSAAKKWAKTIQHPSDIEDLNQETFQRFMYQPTLPPVDLVIRTSGQTRISDFLLYHIAYAELFFIPSYWPDFSLQDWKNVLDNFRQIHRKFGG